MAAQFSEGWSGTPMWQLKEQQELQLKRERIEREQQAGDVLSIEAEGSDGHRSVLIVSRVVDGAFQDTKVRGPRRKKRAEAVKDGLELRSACRRALEAEREADVRRKCHELTAKVWGVEELPWEDVSVDEPCEELMRRRLATRPIGTGWQRVGDREMFRHANAPMAFDPKQCHYLQMDEVTQSYRVCDPPHDPVEHAVSVNASTSLAGRSDEDLAASDRPRTVLLKELIKTGAAMKHPLYFLDQPAACFAMFDGLRGGAAAEWCARHFHTRLLPRLSTRLQYWGNADLSALFSSLCEELEAQLLQLPELCWEGASVGVVLVLGDRVAVATLGAVRALLLPADGSPPPSLGSSAPSAGERRRCEEAGGEVVGEDANAAAAAAVAGAALPPFLVRKRVQPRQWQLLEVGSSTEEEVRRILDGTADAFATLGLAHSAEETADGKAAHSAYKRLALKVHPDKVSEELKSRAKLAFEKAEAAAVAVEAFCDADAAAAAELHRVLHAGGATGGAMMTRSRACEVLGIGEAARVEEAQAAVAASKAQLVKLGILTDGRYGHADQARAALLLDGALEVLVAPAGKLRSEVLEPLPAMGALGLRDLKLPRQVLTCQPQVDVVRLEAEGSHHLVLLNHGAAVLSDDEVLSRVRAFAGQPKAASLLVVADAAARAAERHVSGPGRFASCLVAVLHVESDADLCGAEPPSKRARLAQKAEKVRARHILLKHKDLKMKMDPDVYLRQKGPVVRPVAQAERELMRLKEALTRDPEQFHVLARKHSECKSALSPGLMAGDLGWVSRGSLGDATLEEMILGLEVGQLSDIVGSARGVHVIQRYA